MPELQKTLELAEISFEGENYQDSYKKYSEAVELDMSNVKGWIGKALSSAHLAEPTGNKFKEASVCLKKAKELGVNESDLEKISQHIILSANEFIKKCNQKVSAYLMEKEKKPMATGELYAVRNIGQLADRFEAFNNEWGNYKLAIDFAFSSLDYENANERKEEVLSIIDFIYSESNSHFHKDILTELATFRNKILEQIKESNPTFFKAEPQNKDGGCFIATAVYGDYNATEVIELREFRDSYLSKYPLGKKFIKQYYQYSPFLASVIRKNNQLKLISRVLIIKPVSFFWLKIKENKNR